MPCDAMRCNEALGEARAASGFQRLGDVPRAGLVMPPYRGRGSIKSSVHWQALFSSSSHTAPPARRVCVVELHGERKSGRRLIRNRSIHREQFRPLSQAAQGGRAFAAHELGGNCAIPGHCGFLFFFMPRGTALRTWLVSDSSCAACSLTFFRCHACRGTPCSFVVADDAVCRGRGESRLWAGALPRRGEVMYGSCNVEAATVPTVRGAGLPSSCRAIRSHGGSMES
jgi:hypothetical protein